MSSRTYICRLCGSIRRRSAAFSLQGSNAPNWPRCHEQPMELLTNAQASGVVRLRRDARLIWLAHGKRVIRRAGNRWTPVIHTSQEKRADTQLADYQASIGRPPSKSPTRRTRTQPSRPAR